MKSPLEIIIKAARIGGRAVAWYAEVQGTATQNEPNQTLFYRKRKHAVLKLIARLCNAHITVQR